MDNDNDVSSNPLTDDHLPVGGEVTDEEGNTTTNPDISDDMDLRSAEEEATTTSPNVDEDTDIGFEEDEDNFDSEETENTQI